MGIRNAVLLATLSAILPLTAHSFSETKQDSAQQAPLPTFRAESRLVLVDVVAEYDRKELHARALLTDLKRDDFRVFDNGKEMPISSFDTGIAHSTRPIALWLIVQCPEIAPTDWYSDFLRGNTQFLRAALLHLDPNDVVGVAHWCDDGTSGIDLEPGHDPDAALNTVENLLAQKPVPFTVRPGELAMQRMVRSVVVNGHAATPERLPVLLFLYNDHAATESNEADHIIEDVLETSGVVFGTGNGRWPYDPQMMFRDGRTFWLVHYYSQETGGRYYVAPSPKFLPAALDYILVQMHLRYTLGFRPLAVDGKRHTIKVKLTKEAEQRYHGVRLRFRQAYVPVARAGAER